MITKWLRRNMLTKEKALNLLERAVEMRGSDYVYRDHFGYSCLYAVPVEVTDDREATIVALREKEPEDIFSEVPERTFSDLRPACIVGQVVALYDPSLLTEIYAATDVNAYGLFAIPALRGIAEPDAVSLLNTAQHYQDEGSSWGEALEAVREKAKRL